MIPPCRHIIRFAMILFDIVLFQRDTRHISVSVIHAWLITEVTATINHVASLLVLPWYSPLNGSLDNLSLNNCDIVFLVRLNILEHWHHMTRVVQKEKSCFQRGNYYVTVSIKWARHIDSAFGALHYASSACTVINLLRSLCIRLLRSRFERIIVSTRTFG